MRHRLMVLPLLMALVAPQVCAEDVVVPAWQVVGPFEAGSREGLVQPLADSEGRVPQRFTFEERFPSVLAEGGMVSWKRVESERDADGKLTGNLALKLEGVDWDARGSEWGAAAMLNTAACYATFTLDAPQLMLVEASRCGGLIDGVPFSGDPYGAGIAKSVVSCRAGENTVLLTSQGFGPERSLAFRLVPIPATGPALRIVETDVLLPDLVQGRAGEGMAGVPILNLTNDWIASVTVSLSGAGIAGSATLDAPLAPRAAVKVPVPASWGAPAGEPRDAPVVVRAWGRCSAGRAGASASSWTCAAADASASLRVRTPQQPRRETFRSHIDGSAQEFGLLPSSSGEGAGQALLMTTHGAGVGAVGQAAAYSPKDWMHVVAPSNRRPYGFDWNDWGRLDFEEVMQLAEDRLRPDPARVYLGGHSMGGHGAWILGALHADRFAAVVPSAGWSGYDAYLPFTLRRSQSFAAPELTSLMMRVLDTGRAVSVIDNLRATPVLAIHGSKDDNVPPPQSRLLVGPLRRAGARVELDEVEGMGHWWDIDKERGGADCVDSKRIESFLRAASLDAAPRRIAFTTTDVDASATSFWAEVLAQRRCASPSRVEAEILDGTHVRVMTSNVAWLALDLSSHDLGLAAEVAVEINGDVSRVSSREGKRAFVAKPSGEWVSEREAPVARVGPGPGGLAKALFRPFAIVVGTQGDAAWDERLLDVARTIASAWWVRGNGFVTIVRDTDVTAKLRAERGLVLLGGPDENAETQRIAKGLLVTASASDGVRLAGRRVPGRDLACVHWQPHPEARQQRVLVMQATSLDAALLLHGLQPIAPGSGLPDLVIASPRVRERGFGGFVAAAILAPDWTLDPASTWRAFD